MLQVFIYIVLNYFCQVKLLSVVKLSFAALRTHRGRAFLTMLGIIIGITSVIIINSVGAGAQSLIFNQVKRIGSNLVGVLPGHREGSEPPAAAFGIAITTLSYDDAVALSDPNNVPYALAATPYIRGTANFNYKNRSHDSNFTGVSYQYLQVESAEIAAGTFFALNDERGLERVAVIGDTVKEELFGNEEALGKTIRIKQVNFQVIGVLKKRGTVAFQNQDDQVLIPITTAQKILLGVEHVGLIRVKVAKAEQVAQTMQDVASALRIRHGIKDEADDDFFVGSQELILNTLGMITNIVRYLLIAIGAISLIVGGIGIMNIMFVSVNERTREIGLRKAIGAKERDILQQFLLEAINLTSVAGLIGIGIGVGISFAVATVAQAMDYDWDFVVSPLAILFAVTFSAAIGISFGYFPARKASQMEAIEALRYE